MAGVFDPIRSVHCQAIDPGSAWVPDSGIAVDAATKTGGQTVVTPNVIPLAAGGYRMYYTQMGNVGEYERASGHIRSAVSDDGASWRKERGIRVEPHEPDASQRVLCPDVVPLPDGRWRMYFEAKSPGCPSVILSATSDDLVRWVPEAGVRLASDDESYGAPRCLYLSGEASGASGGLPCRMYAQRYSYPFRPGLEAENHIISAISADGLAFHKEPGVRIRQETPRDSYAVQGPEVLRLPDGAYRMYYAAWQVEPLEARILTARSRDGLTWVKEPAPCIDVGGSREIVKASEPCVIDLPDGRFRMYFEACDRAGQWRILSATSAE